MTSRRFVPLRFAAPLLVLFLPSLAACGGERGVGQAVADEVAEAGGALEAEAPHLPAAPPDGVALLFDDEALLERIRVSDGEARFIARRDVPGGRIVRAELTEEEGRLVYAYDLEVDGAPGVARVVVDALNARVVRSGSEADPST